MPFRVIVVGAGVVGLTASHCLQHAGIDHVVLEKRNDVAPAEGASIASKYDLFDFMFPALWSCSQCFLSFP
jgi:2-polyprenyl-6-methoxyphenol hydroxylase-like FAD-dependent oxidoreductase